MKCKYCDQNEAIDNSHIVPKFVFDWMKKTGKTGILRNSLNPNVPLQDGWKAPILCTACETEFSIFEGKFQRAVFSKIANYEKPFDGVVQFDDLNRKAIYSIVWRVVVDCSYFNKPDQFTEIEIEKLKLYLPVLKDAINRGSTTKAKTYFVPLVQRVVEKNNIPGNFLYFDRIVQHECRIYDGDYYKLVVIVKLPFSLIVTELIENVHDYWFGCEIAEDNPIQNLGSIEIPEYVKLIIEKYCKDYSESLMKVSPKQRAKISERWKKARPESGVEKSMRKDFHE